MRNTILLFILLVGLCSCQDDENNFNVSLDDVSVTFEPRAGGAVMLYQVPDNSEIYAIQASYENDFGETVVKQATYLMDSILLDGFKAARQNIPINISLRNEQNEESVAKQMTFEVNASATYSFFEQIEVLPYWNGFMVIYETPRYVDGYANIFYMGTNPMTQELDTLLLETFQIEGGRDTIYYPLEQERDNNTVIISTEDFKGHFVRQQIWTDIAAYGMEKMESKNFEILDPLDIVLEDESTNMIGPKYLFDGDTKGTQRMANTTYDELEYTFIMGPDAIGKYIILDLKETKIIAKMRFYGILYSSKYFGYFWENSYTNKLPNEITILGSNTPDEEDSWKQIGYYKESPNLTESSWAYPTNDYNNRVEDYEALVKADPCYVDVPFIISTQAYRYYKIVINSCFTVPYYLNNSENVTFHELEVYAKKD